MTKNSSYFIFGISLVYCTTIILIERILGIGVFFHPDVLHYMENYIIISDKSYDNNSYLGNGMYFVYKWLNGSISVIIFGNIIIYALTNSLLWNFLSRIGATNRRLIFLTLFFLILHPYRAHLATTGLKDTIIIFLVVIAFSSKRILISVGSIALLFIFRTAAIVYLLQKLILKMRFYHLILLCFLASIIMVTNFHFFEYALFRIDLANTGEFQVRSVDRIPTFQNYGLFGTFLRVITWPFLLATGTFLIFSPSALLLPIAIGNFFLFVLISRSSNKYSVLISLWIVLASIVSLAPGLMASLRYALPALTLAIMFCKFDGRRYEA